MSHIITLTPNSFVDMDTQTVHRGGEPVRMTDMESRILGLLVANAGHPVNAADIIEEIWGCSSTGNKDNLKTQIRRIRRRIETDPSHPRHILCVHGEGYLFRT
ncbi:MAG: winged helix-turn-helix domain-containing protein [Bacilli bacterium]